MKTNEEGMNNMEKKEVLSVRNLDMTIGKKKILKGIGFSTYDAEIIGLLGPNGSGKSTMMKCISTVYIPTKGTIRINGHNVMEEHDRAMKSCGISIEGPVYYPHMSGMDNLKLIGSYKGVGKGKIDEIAAFSGLGDRLKDSVKTYSLGMKQRLSLSMAIIDDPKLILLDEPTNGLDPDAVFSLREELLSMKEKGASILVSSHSLGEMEKICDRFLFIKDGEIIKELDAKQVYDKLHSYRITVDSLESAERVLTGRVKYKITNNAIECAFQNDREFAAVMRQLSNTAQVLSVDHTRVDLETLYKEIYGDHDETAHAQ